MVRRARPLSAAAALALLGVAACADLFGFQDLTLGDAGVGADGGGDSGHRSDARRDATQDAPVSHDATVDSGHAESGPVDSGHVESGRVDGGHGDSGATPDARPETSLPDASPKDAGGPCGCAPFEAGACKALDGGACLYTLASHQVSPVGIVVSGSVVIWTEDDPTVGAVMKESTSASAPALAVASGQINPFEIATLGGNVYWTNRSPDGGSVAGALVGGSGLLGETVVTGGPPGVIVAHGDSIFWVQPQGANSRIVSCPLAISGALACPSGGPTLLGGTDNATIAGLTITDGGFYWTEPANGFVRGCPDNCTSGVTNEINSSQASPYRVVAHGSVVYWTDSSAVGDVSWANVIEGELGSGGKGVAAHVAWPIAIAATDRALYWTSGKADGSVMTAALTDAGIPVDGSAQTLVPGQQMPQEIVVSGDSIYWTNRGTDAGTGSVMKLTLPHTP